MLTNFNSASRNPRGLLAPLSRFSQLSRLAPLSRFSQLSRLTRLARFSRLSQLARSTRPLQLSLLSLFFLLSLTACSGGSAQNWGDGGFSGDGNPLDDSHGNHKAISLKIAHFNDSHAQLEPVSTSFVFDPAKPDLKTYVQVGGFTRLVAKIKALRAAEQNFLLLHAGDIFQGTIYFTLYQGVPDGEFLRDMMKLDALSLGNHEFDKGPSWLGQFINATQFAALSANIDVSKEKTLANLIQPYTIKEIGGELVAIVGLTTPVTPTISSPGPNITFTEARTTLQTLLPQITGKGINKIIVLSHMGYEEDVALAEEFPEIDVIVGGHSHTLLGNFSAFGLTSPLPYPTVLGPTQKSICVVQAWWKTQLLGLLDVEFDAGGKVTKCAGAPRMLFADSFQKLDPTDATKTKKIDLTAPEKTAVVSVINNSGLGEIIAEDQAAADKLAWYRTGVDTMKLKTVATVDEDLLHTRLPGDMDVDNKVVLPRGSEIAPVVADSWLWKVNSIGLKAQIALVNAGGVRVSLPKGPLTVEGVYSLMPFGNTLYLLRISGSDLTKAIEAAVIKATTVGDNKGGFPYVAGLRFTADMTRTDGHPITKIEVKDGTTWKALEAATQYLIVMSNFTASGGDKYDIFKDAKSYRYDIGFLDAESFIDYATTKKNLAKTPADTGVTFIR